MATLTITAGPLGGQTLPLTTEVTLGRNPQLAQVTLNDSQISQQHARLTPGPGGTWVLRDLGSTNGTWIVMPGGQRRRLNASESYALKDGDQIELGKTRLVFSARGVVATPVAPVASTPPVMVAAPPPAPAPRQSSLLPIMALGIVGLLLIGGLGLAILNTLNSNQGNAANVASPVKAAGTPAGLATTPAPPLSTTPSAVTATPPATAATSGNPVAATNCTAQEGLARIRQSVVMVFALDANGQVLGTGTGFVLTSTGYIMTNRHVVLDEAKLTPHSRFVVRTGRGSQQYVAQLVNVHNIADLAVIKTESLPDMKPITWGKSERLQPGDNIYATGFGLATNPGIQDYNPTNTNGIVSDRSRVIEGTEFIQHSSPINPGNSGGPLTNACGEVVGVNTLAPQRPVGVVGVDERGNVRRLPAAVLLPVPGVYLAIAGNVAELFANTSVPRQ